VHQFDKVEMFFFVLPERSREHHEEILAIEEDIVADLGIAYRVVVTAAAISARPPRRSTTSRPGSRASSATGDHLLLEHHGLPGSPAERPLS